MENNYSKFNITKSKSEKNIVLGGIILVSGIILFLVSMEMTSSILSISGILIGVAGLVLFIMGISKFSKIKKTFKNTVLTEMFKKLIPDINYSPMSGLSQDIVYGTDFLKRADKFHTEDYLSGSIEEVSFVSSDVRLEERHVEYTKNGTRTYYVTYFLGRIFRFEFNKEFVGSLQVLESGAGKPKSNGYSKIKMESVQFNKKFKTYSTDDLTAFYILTPDIMESIEKLERKHPGRIGLSFRGEYLYVAINNNKDTFELKLFRKIDDSMINEFKADLMVIKDFIMALKLNNNLFKK